MFEFLKKSLLDKAKIIISNHINHLGFQTSHSHLSAYLPNERTTAQLATITKNNNLGAHDLALMLIDAGYSQHREAESNAVAEFSAQWRETLGNLTDDSAESLRAAAAIRHDRLLTEVFKVAVLHGTSIAPLHGSVGRALQNSIGELIEPLEK